VILLLGGSGLIGRETLCQLRAQKTPTRAAFRRLPRTAASTGSDDGAIEFFEDAHWSNEASLQRLMEGVDTVLCAIGTTIAQAGSEGAFRAVDFEIIERAAREARRAKVARFALVSAVGANANSKIFYNRVKGEAETAVIEQNFAQTLILRPSLLLGDRSDQAARPGERIAQSLAPAFSWMMRGGLARYRPIHARDVACAMINTLLTPERMKISPLILEGQALLDAANAPRPQ
jgi:uncharacterized protein YbjT (DUF2867 family)